MKREQAESDAFDGDAAACACFPGGGNQHGRSIDCAIIDRFNVKAAVFKGHISHERKRPALVVDHIIGIFDSRLGDMGFGLFFGAGIFGKKAGMAGTKQSQRQHTAREHGYQRQNICGPTPVVYLISKHFAGRSFCVAELMILFGRIYTSK